MNTKTWGVNVIDDYDDFANYAKKKNWCLNYLR